MSMILAARLPSRTSATSVELSKALRGSSDSPFGLLFRHVGLDGEAGGDRVAPEHLDGLQRIGVEILVDQAQLVEDVVGHRDDVAADGIRLEDVEQLARAGPDELGLGTVAQNFYRLGHQWHRVDAGVGDAAGKYRHDRGRLRRQTGGNAADLIERQDSGDVEDDTVVRQLANEIAGKFLARVGDGNLDVDV